MGIMQVGEKVTDAWDGGVYDSSDSDLDLPEPSWFLQLKEASRPVAVEPVPETPPEQTKEADDTREDIPEECQKPATKSPRRSKRMNISEPADSSPRSAKRRLSTPLLILTTGLSNNQTKRLQKAIELAPSALGTKIILHANIPDPCKQTLPRYTHLVASVGKDTRATRTFKYLAGVAAGAIAVRPEWLMDSVRHGQMLSEDRYLVAGDSAMPLCGLKTPIVRGGLLNGYSVYLWDGAWDAGETHTKGQLVCLVRTLGATVARKVPRIEVNDEGVDGNVVRDVRSSAGKVAAGVPARFREVFEMSVSRHQAVILVDQDAIKGAAAHITLDAIVQQTQGLCPCRTKSWLFDCISANDVL